MNTTEVISVRVPESWGGRVNAALARAQVTAWLQRPMPLARDPGPGAHKLNLRLTSADVARLGQMTRRSASSAIRSVLALHIANIPKQKSGGVGRLIAIALSGIAVLALLAGHVGPPHSSSGDIG